MSARAPAKSILKRPVRQVPGATDEQKAQAEKDRKNLQIALQHAYLIQHRKDVEAAILDSVTTLVDFPATSVYTAKEAITFVALVKAFQPSDYDSLVEERCIDGRCGYALCANPPRSKTMGDSVAWKLSKGMADWCSDDCAKKGLYIKTQLSETPAWERVPEQQPNIQLHDDDQLGENNSAVRRANRAARVDEWRQKVDNDEQLARERDEKVTSMRRSQVMSEVIVERQPKVSRPAKPEANNEHHDYIEGYKPRRTDKINQSEDAQNHEDSDND